MSGLHIRNGGAVLRELIHSTLQDRNKESREGGEAAGRPSADFGTGSRRTKTTKIHSITKCAYAQGAKQVNTNHQMTIAPRPRATEKIARICRAVALLSVAAVTALAAFGGSPSGASAARADEEPVATATTRAKKSNVDTPRAAAVMEIAEATDPSRVAESYVLWIYETLKSRGKFTKLASGSSEILASRTRSLDVVLHGWSANEIHLIDAKVSLSTEEVTVDKESATILVEAVFKTLFSGDARWTGSGPATWTINLENAPSGWQVVGEQTTDELLSLLVPTDEDANALKNQIEVDAKKNKSDDVALLARLGFTRADLESKRSELKASGMKDSEAVAEIDMVLNDRLTMLRSQDAAQVPNRDGLVNRTYNRNNARAYADRWWNDRNPAWRNYDPMGGDCTNYVSQILYAGGIPKDKGGSYLWYWDSDNARSSSWTSVNSLWTYIYNNTRLDGYNGPQGLQVTDRTRLQTGDVIQLSSNGSYFHTYAVYSAAYESGRFVVRITSHTNNRWKDDLDATAPQYGKRYISILGWRAP